ncbi:MAG: preprotein translocase subunit SecE [bacterium]|jgi:preprotein translocase subunit SecE
MSNKKEAKNESKIAGFFKGVRTEFRKIIWPDRDALIKQLIAVVVVTVIAGTIIAVMDYGFQNLINLLTSIGA